MNKLNQGKVLRNNKGEYKLIDAINLQSMKGESLGMALYCRSREKSVVVERKKKIMQRGLTLN